MTAAGMVPEVVGFSTIGLKENNTMSECMSWEQIEIWKLLPETTDLDVIMRRTGQTRRQVRDRLRRIMRRYDAADLQEAATLAAQYAAAREKLGTETDFVWGSRAKSLLGVRTTAELDALGLPYLDAVNPHYRTGPSARLYDVRVLADHPHTPPARG